LRIVCVKILILVYKTRAKRWQERAENTDEESRVLLTSSTKGEKLSLSIVIVLIIFTSASSQVRESIQSFY
jgi:hypothetical protein